MSHWADQIARLRFQLGEVTLGAASLRVRARYASWDTARSGTSEPLPTLSELQQECDGFLIRSHALEADQPAISQRDGLLVYVASRYMHYRLSMSGDFTEYQGKFSAKTRSTLRRKVKKFEQFCGGGLEWRRYATEDELKAFHVLARDVSQRSYQERLLDAGLPDSKEFVEQMCRLATEDRVRAFVLFHRHQPVSYLYCPVDQGRLIYAYLGYDPSYLAHSVGTVLFWVALESLFAEERFQWFDFTEGESDHKRLFATHGTSSGNVFYLRPSIRNRLLVRSHRAFDRLSSGLGGWLERHGLKAKLKRWLRFGFQREGTV